jgi:deazaflavin-dependent oxidoreductase (nitroreductase family)
MSSMTARLWRGANAAAVWVYRRTGGRLGGKAKGAPVLLLTAPGRKSGRAHTVPVAYVLRDGWYYLAASAGGAPAEPQWIRNLRATPTATIQVGSESHPVAVEVLRGADRDDAWRDVIVATYPFFADYEKKVSRVIAIARVRPTPAA